MEEKKAIRAVKADVTHNVIMENRGKLSISGVEDVDSFNEEEIVLQTEMGILKLHGCDLHISKLSVEIGEVVITGKVSAMEYDDAAHHGGSLLARMFK